MKNVFLIIALAISIIGNTQNIIEVSIYKLSRFALYGKDSLHLMIKNSGLGSIDEIYKNCNKKLVFNKQTKKLYRFDNNTPHDTLDITKISFKDSIYTFVFDEIIYDSGDGEYVTHADTYIVVDIRKTSKNKKVPLLCYYWYWPINDYSKGYVSDFVTINLK